MAMTKAEKTAVLETLTAAFSAPWEPARASGCGRAYVSVSGDRALINAVAAAAKKLGLIFQRNAYYGFRNAIYVGYDNADGRAHGKANAIAAALNAAGIKAYVDLGAD